MADLTVRRLQEFDAIFGGGMRRVRAGLGVSSFGLQVVELPAGFDGYPDHCHIHDRQEEVYIPMSGSCNLTVGGVDHRIGCGDYVRVGPTEHRKITTSDSPVRLLVIGATPGEPYEAPEFTEEGAASPGAPPPEHAHDHGHGNDHA